ncbi:MAG: hypothetical protein KGJ13_10355 [Patescibacteria group bacterium]|nr:hypothetical protein [Patescibacteria group bacterium]
MRKKREESPEIVRATNAKYRAKPENRRKAATNTRIWHAENKAYSNPRRQMRKQKERNAYPWKGPLDAARRRSVERNLPFDLDDAWAQARWTGRCELSDIPFIIGARGNGPRYFAASIDRIKPELGYTKENARFILWAINAFKYTGTDEDLFMVAEALMKKRSLALSKALSK